MRFLGPLYCMVRTLLLVGSGAMLSVVGVFGTWDGTPIVVDTAPVVDTEPGQPLTAAFENVPAHGSERGFRFRVAFSEDVATSYKTLRDESFTVTEGGVTEAWRVDGRNDLWEITVEPDSREAVTITLPGGRACGTSGAVCTGGDTPKPLGNSPSATVQLVPWPSTHLYVLKVETVKFEPFADLNTGGAIESFGQDLLLAEPSGRLALIRSNGTVEYLGGRVPMNRGALEALDFEPIVEGRFRVADILLKRNSAGELDLFVSHHYFVEGGGLLSVQVVTHDTLPGRRANPGTVALEDDLRRRAMPDQRCYYPCLRKPGGRKDAGGWCRSLAAHHWRSWPGRVSPAQDPDSASGSRLALREARSYRDRNWRSGSTDHGPS